MSSDNEGVGIFLALSTIGRIFMTPIWWTLGVVSFATLGPAVGYPLTLGQAGAASFVLIALRR
tara:strand:+ start:417 stop:605 length:189 start_codon:yes stop_codon:yes gene_type:complete